MPQPKTKIIMALATERRRLEQNLSGLTEEDMLKNGVVGELSIKDILAYLANWEAHMPVWLENATGCPRRAAGAGN